MNNSLKYAAKISIIELRTYNFYNHHWESELNYQRTNVYSILNKKLKNISYYIVDFSGDLWYNYYRKLRKGIDRKCDIVHRMFT